MGLLILGKVGERFFQEETLITAEELAELFGIGDALKRQPRFVDFKLPQQKVTKKNGNEHFPSQISMPSTFAATYQGNQVQIQYYEQQVNKIDPQTKTPYIHRVPNKVSHKGKRNRKNKRQHLELIVFLMLHYRCGTSPMYQQGQEVFYTLYDQKEEGLVQFKEHDLDFQFRQSVMNNPNLKTLRRRAAGIGINNTMDMELKVLISKIMSEYEKAKKKDREGSNLNAQAFRERFNEPYSHLAGIIKEAIDLGVIAMVPGERGATVFMYGIGTKRKGVITSINKGVDPIPRFTQFILNRFENYVPYFEEMIHNHKINTSQIDYVKSMENANHSEHVKNIPVKKELGELTVHESLDFAIQHDYVAFDREKMKVYFIKSSSGNFDGDPICEVKNRKTWKDEAAMAIQSNKDMQTLLKRKIMKKYTDLK